MTYVHYEIYQKLFRVSHITFAVEKSMVGSQFSSFFFGVQDPLEDLEAHGSFASYVAVDCAYMTVYLVSTIDWMDKTLYWLIW